MKNDLRLDFNCPVDIHSMPKCEGGYSCQQCEKKVFDYSNMSINEFEQAERINRVESQCGIYKAYQLDGVYGDWRDNVTRVYRNTIRKASKKKRMIFILPFIAGFMFLVGCGRKGVCGMMYYESDMINPDNPVLTDSTSNNYQKPEIDKI